jgi:hypothetical protein
MSPTPAATGTLKHGVNGRRCLGRGQRSLSAFDTLAEAMPPVGVKTHGHGARLMGWVAKDSTSCSFPQSVYSDQLACQPLCRQLRRRTRCGSNLSQWVGWLHEYERVVTSPRSYRHQHWPVPLGRVNGSYLAGKFGTAANGGVAIYDLDNEPSWWDGATRRASAALHL